MCVQVPTFLSVLIGILNSVAEKQCQSLAPTPPPSPGGSPHQHPQVLSTPPQQTHLSPFGTPTQSLLSTPTKHPSHISPFSQASHVLSPSFAPLDRHLEEVCVSSLSCLSHLFNWMPLSSNITPHVLDTIFIFASLGCNSGNDASDVSGHLGSLAMDCVIELLVKNCVPREFEAFLMKLFEKSFSLLQRLTGLTERGETINFLHLDERCSVLCMCIYMHVHVHVHAVYVYIMYSTICTVYMYDVYMYMFSVHLYTRYGTICTVYMYTCTCTCTYTFSLSWE